MILNPARVACDSGVQPPFTADHLPEQYLICWPTGGLSKGELTANSLKCNRRNRVPATRVLSPIRPIGKINHKSSNPYGLCSILLC